MYFFRTTSIGGGGGGSDDFYHRKKIFSKTSHPFWSFQKKKFEKIMKNIGDMAKRTFIKKMQKNLNFIICKKLGPVAIVSS